MDVPEFAAHRLRAAFAGLNFILTGRRFTALAAKADFNPRQPRVPRGNVDGGRWTRAPGGGSPVVRVQAGPRNPGRGRGGPIRPGARLENPSPAQLARLEASRLAMNRALGQVREVDPRWKPTPQLYETIEGEIAAYQAITREAEARIRSLAPSTGLGHFAGDSIPARGSGRNFSVAEREATNGIGRRSGCHTCGTTYPGTPSGNFVPDHQPPSRLAVEPYRLYPQCILCSDRQGGHVLWRLRRRSQNDAD